MSNLRAVSSIRTKPPLTDIAGQLRVLADRIEAGELAPRAAYVVMHCDDPPPCVFGFGEVATPHAIAGLLQQAGVYMLLSDVSRD